MEGIGKIMNREQKAKHRAARDIVAMLIRRERFAWAMLLKYARSNRKIADDEERIITTIKSNYCTSWSESRSVLNEARAILETITILETKTK